MKAFSGIADGSGRQLAQGDRIRQSPQTVTERAQRSLPVERIVEVRVRYVVEVRKGGFNRRVQQGLIVGTHWRDRTSLGRSGMSAAEKDEL